MVTADDMAGYKKRFKDTETVSMWQSLSFGANYKSAYCMAVCPAGEDIIPLFDADKKSYVDEILRPLKEKPEPIYVRPGTPTETAAKRNKNKQVRYIQTAPQPASIKGFLRGVPLAFNPEKAKNFEATYHFIFTGKEPTQASVLISKGKVNVTEQLDGQPQLTVWADSEAWIRVVNKEISAVRAFLTGRLKWKGDIALLLKFQKIMA